MKLDKSTKILIIGLGLIGGSYAEGLTKAGFSVYAINRSQKAIDYALEHKIIIDGTTEIKPEFISQFKFIVFGLYPKAMMEWLDKNQHCFAPGTIITDVSGVKGTVVAPIQKMLRSDVEFISAHPMAGRESSGIEYATSEVFKGANYIVTPTSQNTEEAIELCKDLGEILGFKRVSVLSPEEHDEMIGFLSQLTHCIAVSLMTCKNSEHLVDYTGDSFRDLTRIAKINENMWPELFSMNKTELLNQMDLFVQELNRLRTFIETDDTEKIKDLMRLSTSRRKLFDKPEK